MSGRRRVVVIGGGVAGLTTAYRLALDPAAPEVTVLEADHRVGGKLRPEPVGGFELEAGADSFVARKPWAVELCRELGLGRELIAPGASGAWLWTAAGLVRMPADAAFGIPGDVGDVLRWPGLSRAGRRRAARDLLIRRRRDDDDESLGGLLRRRLGDEATERAVAPLLAGLFAGDIDRLGARAHLPRAPALGGVPGKPDPWIAGGAAGRHAAGEPGPMFLGLRGGTATLTDRLAERLGDGVVRTGIRAEAIEPAGSGYEVRDRGGGAVGGRRRGRGHARLGGGRPRREDRPARGR